MWSMIEHGHVLFVHTTVEMAGLPGCVRWPSHIEAAQPVCSQSFFILYVLRTWLHFGADLACPLLEEKHAVAPAPHALHDSAPQLFLWTTNYTVITIKWYLPKYAEDMQTTLTILDRFQNFRPFLRTDWPRLSQQLTWRSVANNRCCSRMSTKMV